MALLVAGLLLYLHTQFQPVELDEKLCPINSPPAYKLSILLDMTDPISSTQRENILRRINSEIASADEGMLITVGVVRGDEIAQPPTEPQLCKPKEGREASKYYENPRLVEKKFREDFNDPMSKALDEILSIEPANRSPIMESLQSLVARSGGVSAGSKYRLVVISDLLQHSDVFSFYRGQRWQDFVESRWVERLGRNLDGAEVLILQIPNLGAGRASGPHVLEFWAEYFDHQGARSVVREVVGDL